MLFINSVIVIILGDVYSQEVLDSCDVSVVPMLSSKQPTKQRTKQPKVQVSIIMYNSIYRCGH